MSRSAAHVLTGTLRRGRRALDVIPHGVPDLPLVDAETVKPALGLAGREVILSFGLLGPGKGYELAIDALPAVVAAHPTACYVIVGATHPDLLATEGEAYRRSLVERVARLGMGEPRPVRRSVRRPGRADPLARGRRRLRHALPEPRPDRVRHPVVRDGRRPGDRLDAVRLRGGAARRRPGRPRAARLARGVGRRPQRRCSRTTSCEPRIGRRAYEHSRGMVWSNVARPVPPAVRAGRRGRRIQAHRPRSRQLAARA